jgi:hypothetical protein
MSLLLPRTQKSPFHITVWSGSQLFLLLFGPEAKIHNTVCSGTGFHITVPGGSRRKFGFLGAIIHFLIEKSISYYRSVWRTTFILPVGLVSKFHFTAWPGTGFHITVTEIFALGEYTVICAPPFRFIVTLISERL